MFKVKWRILRGLRADCRGMTMAEICVALMILSLGMVSILALFPKALHSTRGVVDASTGSMVARGAMATMLYRIHETGDPGWDGPWAGNDWPSALPSGVTRVGTVTNIVFQSPNYEVFISGLSSNCPIAGCYMLVRSGRGRSRIYFLIAGASSYTKVVIPNVDPRLHGLEINDSIQIVGPACVGPVAAVTDDNTGHVIYSWVAVIDGESPELIPGWHRTMIFVYARDFDEMNRTGTQAYRFAALSKYRPAYWFASAIAERGF